MARSIYGKIDCIIIEVNKQDMPFDLIRLIHEGVITVNDLDGFSDKLKETVIEGL